VTRLRGKHTSIPNGPPMGITLLPVLWAVCSLLQVANPELTSYLYRPSYCLDIVLRGPAEPYCPQPGDIFLATDQGFLIRAGHWIAGGAGVHHSGILFARSDGRMALIEAGPFNSVHIETLDPIEHMRRHVQAGDQVWIRRRATPLTPEQS